MQRVTISVPQDLATVLQHEAQRRHASASSVARAALEEYLGIATGRQRTIPFAGIGTSGDSDTARNFESVLEREWRADSSS